MHWRCLPGISRKLLPSLSDSEGGLGNSFAILFLCGIATAYSVSFALALVMLEILWEDIGFLWIY